jgi:hypothetical protein
VGGDERWVGVRARDGRRRVERNRDGQPV